MEPGIVIVIIIVGVVFIINFYFLAKRLQSGTGRRGKGRNYKPPIEEKQREWRAKEIARRLEREQDEAYERVQLRNKTLDYYDIVRQRHAKLEVLESLGIDPTEVDLDEMDELNIQELLKKKEEQASV